VTRSVAPRRTYDRPGTRAARLAPMGQKGVHVPRRFEREGKGLDCLVYLPPEYRGGADEKWPLVLFLHSSRERGEDIERLKERGIPHVAAELPRFPFVAVSPLCPSGSEWVDLVETLEGVLDEIIAELAVDSRCVLLTGVGMGAFGAWKLAAEHPDRFTSLVPIGGGGDPSWARRLARMPTWAFHGATDDVVPPERTVDMVRALEAQKAPVRLTIIPGEGHDVWARAYEDPEVYRWFLRQSAVAHQRISS
jgi:predicted peptidase